jgi:hypothetical protein
MGKTKEITEDQQKALDAEKAFRDSPLGKNITQLENHVKGHLSDMFDAAGIAFSTDQEDEVMTNFIAASHAAGTIQRLVWEQLDFEAKQREEQNSIPTAKIEKAIKKQAKKEAVKKNRPRGKTSMKKA